MWCVWRKPWRKVHLISRAFTRPLAALPYGRGRTVKPEKSELFAEAYQKYAVAHRLRPDSHEVLHEWGIALAIHAEREHGQRADHLFAEAYKKYAAALELKPDLHRVFYMWGVALATQAKGKHKQEADRLFAQAYQKWASALDLVPDMHELEVKGDCEIRRPWGQEVLYDWGAALATQAANKHGQEADQLFSEACEKYAAAVAVKPDFHKALNNWAIALQDRARITGGGKVSRLLDEARNKLIQIIDVFPGHAYYNLACNSSLQDNETECQEWLKKCHASGGLPSREHIRTDPDFERVRDRDWFRIFLNSLGV